MATKYIGPGVHVRTPEGIGWVNVPPPGNYARPGKAFVRLGDDTVKLFSESDLEVANF